MLSALPYVLAAGGCILVPLVFQKTKGDAVETHWPSSSTADFTKTTLEIRFCVCFVTSCLVWPFH